MPDAFNIPVNPAAALAAGAPEQPSVPVFTSGQSTITFSAASGMITVVWKVLMSVAGSTSWAASRYVPLSLALLVGMLIYFQSVSKGPTSKDKVFEAVFALLNSFTLAAAALGIDASINH